MQKSMEIGHPFLLHPNRGMRGIVYRNAAAASFGMELPDGSGLRARAGIANIRAFHIATGYFEPWASTGGIRNGAINRSAALAGVDLRKHLEGAVLVEGFCEQGYLIDKVEFAYSTGARMYVGVDIDIPSPQGIEKMIAALPVEVSSNMGIVFIEHDILTVLQRMENASACFALSDFANPNFFAMQGNWDMGGFAVKIAQQVDRIVKPGGAAFGFASLPILKLKGKAGWKVFYEGAATIAVKE